MTGICSKLGEQREDTLPGPIAMQFDVTAALPSMAVAGATVTISGLLFLPDAPLPAGASPVAMVLTAGGSYDKRYHHAQIPGRTGYSAAEHLARLGNIVLLTDHLGVGESSRLPDQKQATRQIVALANHAAATQFFDRLARGTLVRDLSARPGCARIGGGHSMGGMQTIIQQANHRTYDGVMIMGYTAEGVHFTMNGRKLRAADFVPKGQHPDYSRNERAGLHEGFHWDDVPADVIAYDDTLAVETPSNIGLDSIRTRIVAEEAGRIDVPIYICLGERDVSPDPRAEPSYYKSCPDITLHLLPKSGHCQTFASTRHQMWNRMAHWARGVAQEKGPSGEHP